MDVKFSDRTFSGDVVYQSDFGSLDDFWWEGSPDVRAEGNRLCVRTTLQRDDKYHFVSSVFVRKIYSGNLMVEYSGRSTSDQSHRNFNFFIHTSMPDGRDLYETRDQRTGDYPEYHVMSNYLFTCLPSDQQNPDGSDKFRYRMRRDPGFVLIKEAHAYACENFRWYRFQYLIRDGQVSVCVDGLPHETYTWLDPKPLGGGYLGFRSYMSHLEFRDLTVHQIS